MAPATPEDRTYVDIVELAASSDVKDIAGRARGCGDGVGRLLQSKIEAARGKELLDGGGMADRRGFKLVHTDGKQVCAAGWCGRVWREFSSRVWGRKGMLS